MNAYQVILFDLDGTIVNSEQGIVNSIRYTLTQLGIKNDSPHILRQMIGPPLEDSFSNLFHLSQKEVEEAVAIFRNHYTDHGVHEFQVYEGIPEALRALRKKNYSVSIATSKPAVFANAILSKAGLTSLFEVIVGSTLERDSDKTTIIREALKDYHSVKLSNVLMVGDRMYDLVGASVNHIASCAVTYGFGTREELLPLNPDHVIDHPYELLNFL